LSGNERRIDSFEIDEEGRRNKERMEDSFERRNRNERRE
jgi:hypothetical protein